MFPILLVLLAFSAAARSGDGIPPDFHAEYSLFNRGVKFASNRRDFRRLDDGTFRYRTETRAAGLFRLIRRGHVVEETIWLIADDRLRPLHYRYEHVDGNAARNVAVSFDWQSRTITNTVDGHSWEMPAEPEVLDKLLYQLAIMRDLSSGNSPLEYVIADGGRAKTYRFEILGEGTVATVFGDLHAIQLVRHRPDRRRITTFWCAPELHFLPVRVENIEDDGRRTVAVLDAVSGLRND
jgi:hypothetical protein